MLQDIIIYTYDLNVRHYRAPDLTFIEGKSEVREEDICVCKREREREREGFTNTYSQVL